MGARIPGATYRLQFNREFTFRQARRLVPYLEELGVTDCYASPYLKARPESTHGYDIADHTSLNPAIGSDADYAAFAAALRERRMGQLLDVVPNHMGIVAGTNAWWTDVLENGQAALHAPFFDVDWRPIKPELAGKVLLPILGDQYGRVLENGELQLELRDGAFWLCYYEHPLPIAPHSYADILRGPRDRLAAHRDGEDERLLELLSILTAIGHLPDREAEEPDLVAERNREKEVVKRRLAALVKADSELRREVAAELRRVNGRKGDPRSFDALDAILQRQAYRLSYWRVAAEEINYRRFFDINDLAALRIENPTVFAETHRLVLRLVREGSVTGLRIDHPDGLWDPAEYFERLQAAYGGGFGDQGLGSGDDERDVSPKTQSPDPNPLPLYVVVEKILAKDEALPEEWAVHGTTGYDFMAAVGGIFVGGANRKRFDDLYARFIGRRIDFHELVYESKRRVMRQSLASEVTVLANRLARLAERDRRSRDFTLSALTDVVREVIACFPVYRTYVTGRPISDRDRAYVELAVAWARRRNPDREASIFQFLRDTLLLQGSGIRSQGSGDAGEGSWSPTPGPGPPDEQREFVMKFQQTTGPVMAKAVEDTAFYIYNRLVALNEVGGEPDAFGVSPAAFHRMNAERLRRWPHTLLSTSTHDTKRSEDVRARSAVLSELPRDWEAAATRWARLNRPHKRLVDDEPAPSSNDEYLLYQTLLGAWPLDDAGRRPSPDPQPPTPAFVERIQQYMAKATKEAKVETSWINPNQAYDEAVEAFVGTILDPNEGAAFLEDFTAFERRIAPFGAVNSLAQTLLKLTAPGVPDLYQGNELWDLSLVDPDNRRPVDYAIRAKLLKSLQRDVARAGHSGLQALAHSLVDAWQDGRIKLYTTWRALRFRRDRPALFREGAYTSLKAVGRLREHVCAFARDHDGERIVVAVPRLLTGLTSHPLTSARLDPPADPPNCLGVDWAGARLVLPDEPPGAGYRNLHTGELLKSDAHGGAGSVVPLASLFADFPVALLYREASR